MAARSTRPLFKVRNVGHPLILARRGHRPVAMLLTGRYQQGCFRYFSIALSLNVVCFAYMLARQLSPSVFGARHSAGRTDERGLPRAINGCMDTSPRRFETRLPVSHG